MSNTITAYFKGRIGVAEAVYQNDYGIVMAFDSIDLPAHFDCYFSRLNQEEALPGVGADSRVAIPNSILADPGNVTVHIPLHAGENDSEVEYVVYFKVIGRARPIDDGTPTQMTAIEQALALLQNPITNIEQIVNEALAFTGETFEEMQEDLDEWKTDTEEGLETWKGGVESDFDNLDAQFQTAVSALTVDSEVQNIRVGDDDVTYASAGDAVRTQFSNVKSEINDVGVDVTPLTLTVDVIDDNPNSVIMADGSVASTASALGASNLLCCKSGATLDYKLSTQNDRLILAVYSASGQVTHSVVGTGYSSYITGSYTFTDSDAYFRIGGVSGSTYRDNYSLDYSYFPPNIVSKATYDAEITSINKIINYSEPTEVKTLLINGGGIKADGTINSGESVAAAYSYSDYVPLQKGSIITYSGVRVTNLCAIAPYNANKIFDSTSAVVASTTISGTWTMPFDGYVRLCCRNTELSGNASFVFLNHIGIEIAELNARVDAIEGTLPSEWQTYLATKKVDIKSALVAIGDSGEAFTFVTDCHVPRNNMLTPKILKYLEPSCPVNYHINGGDYIDLNTDSAQSAINVLWAWKDAMGDMTEYVIRGNHDFNNYDGSNASNEITVGQFYAVMNRQIENIVDTNGKTYYCIDNESQKIRIIVLDSSLSDKTAMYAWFSTKLTELDSSWTILVMQHYLWGSTTSTIHNNGQLTIDAINAVYSQIHAKFIGILAGHTHVDNDDTESVNGYLLIARDTNMIKGESGTNALSFDYVTINTSAKTINFTKVGRGSDLSLSY